MANLKTLLVQTRALNPQLPLLPLNSASVAFKLLMFMIADTPIVGLGTKPEVFLQDGVQLFVAKMPMMSES